VVHDTKGRVVGFASTRQSQNLVMLYKVVTISSKAR
jgi:hypothetical protein